MNGNEEVGKISYSVVIDTAALKAGTKTAEQAIRTSFNNGTAIISKSTSAMDKSIASTVAQLAVMTASLIALREVGNFLGDSIDSANKFQSAMLGLQSVSQAFTGDSDKALQAAKALSSDGLLPLGDAATSLKNLLAAGFNLDQAIELTNRFKDSAAFARQGSLTFGEAVRSATEGIKNGNSILVDNAGVTKNLSVILQEAGFSAQDLQKASSDAGVRMAIFNGIIRETNAQVGDAAKLAKTAAGADAEFAYATNQLEIRMGTLANSLRKDATSSLANFISENQDAVISIGSGVGATIALTAAIYGLSFAFKKGLIPALNVVAKHPVIAALTILVGIISSMVVSNLLDELGSGFEDAGDGAATMGKSMGAASDSAIKLGKDLAKINRDYIESLADIVKRHQESVKDLTKQILDENSNYNAAVQQRVTAFQLEQSKEADLHAEKVATLQTQIDFLRKYQNNSNRQQLSELQFALAKENSEYDKSNQERQDKYDADAAAEKLTSDQRTTELTARLAEEQAILDKHAEDVAAVRDVMLLDEIDKLKRGRDEQIQAAQEASAGISSAYGGLGSNLAAQFKDIGKTSGDEMGKAFSDALGNAFRKTFEDLIKGIDQFMKDLGGGIRDASKAFASSDFQKAFTLSGGNIGVALGRLVTGQFADGGYTGAGGANDPAGIVHRGEYVLPKSMVNQASGLPKPEAIAGMGGGGNSYKIDIGVSGVIVSSPQDERRLAEVMARRINEVMQQKGLKPAVEGIR